MSNSIDLLLVYKGKRLHLELRDSKTGTNSNIDWTISEVFHPDDGSVVRSHIGDITAPKTTKIWEVLEGVCRLMSEYTKEKKNGESRS